jgi:hypothetical protein
MRAGREVPRFLSKVQIGSPARRLSSGCLFSLRSPAGRASTSCATAKGFFADGWGILMRLPPAKRGYSYRDQLMHRRALSATLLDLVPVDIFNLTLAAEAKGILTTLFLGKGRGQ